MSAGSINLTMPDFTNAAHIGDTENHKILHLQQNNANFYGITVNDQAVGYLMTAIKDVASNPIEEIVQVYVEPQFRGQNLITKLIFFLKSWLKKPFLVGNIQSRDGQAIIQAMARTQRFPMFWVNVKTGEKSPYNPDEDHFSLQPYRSLLEPTDWQILIEALSEDGNQRLITSVPCFLEANDWRRGISWFE